MRYSLVRKLGAAWFQWRLCSSPDQTVSTVYSALPPEIETSLSPARTQSSPSTPMIELVLASKLSAPGEKVTIVQKLGTNTRAMAIKVDAVTAVGGFVTPGDYVDVLMTQGGGDELSTVTILQNIRVIGVDQTAEEQTDTPEVAQTVTVEVTPEDGQKLALAQKAGTLSLTLRTLDNVLDQPLQMIELTDLLQKESPVEELKKKRTIVVRRGSAVEVVELN